MMDVQINLWFTEFLDALNQFVVILDRTGKVIRANEAALAVTGRRQEDLLGLPFWDIPWSILTHANRQSLREAIHRAELGDAIRSELAIRRRGDLKLAIDFTIQPILDDHKAVRYILAEGWDDTAYKQTSEELYRSEARFRTIYEKAGVGIMVRSVDGRIMSANPAFQAMLGYTLEELVQKDYLDVVHPKDRPLSKKLFREIVAGKRFSYSAQKRYLHKDGRIVWGNSTTSMVSGPGPEVQYVIAIVEDISTRKQFESELIELQRRLMRGREMERVRIAQDLHDGPLQEIIGVSFQIKDLETSLADPQERAALEAIREALHRVSRSIRAVCGELRPPTLVPFGLEKTIRSHAEEYQAAHPEVHLELDLAEDEQNLSELVRLVLYRIYQEAMNNIQRHSAATDIKIRFELDRDSARLEVRDNGRGFVLPDRWVDLANAGHLGLVGAMEQAKDAGGSLKISSARGRGTLIRVKIPRKEEKVYIQVPLQEGHP